jgi:hypothetical protein
MTNIRGKTVAEVLAIAAASYDELTGEAVNDAANMVADFGGTEDEIEAMRELQRKIMEQDRKAYLAKYRAFLERGGEPLQ